ncbi:zinc ribbon domain-containing protein [Streptomyces scopuliridis]|uniref:zinc ribbon domain-containing protein n=1 Tax=Streptomyces scopuliridis TaxID=452529 RepID=UPI002DD879C5|nr:zinc ribbon domain-containing protein [Streptomyces scopuliridis]WSB35399.1 zinc ribbon domain-containing protein [Streptomyces scopuliridis]
MACASASAFRGLDAITGDVLNAGVLAGRVGWLADLVQAMCAEVTGAHWNRSDLAQLASGQAPSGEKLPSNAWMALRTLGWTANAPQGVYVPDRVRRIAEEQAGRVLRSAWWRTEVTGAVLATWPMGSPDPLKRGEAEWGALREALPDGDAVAASVLRARTRQIDAFRIAHGRLPGDLCELEAPPGGGYQVVLAAADKQLAALARCEEDPAQYAALTVRLPVRPDPRARTDWHPVLIRFRLPPTIGHTDALHMPTLRLSGGRLRLDVAHTAAVPKTRRNGHVRAVAFDYGLNTLLTGGVLTLSGGAQPTVLTNGRPVFFRPDGVLAKADRLRLQAEQLWTKAEHLKTLIAGRTTCGLRPDALTVVKLAVLRTEHARVSRRRTRLNEQLAKAAARFMVAHALAAHASVIYLEDLRDMEARGKGRTLNTRLSTSVRGKIVSHIRHQAAKYGIAVVIVPARGTSKYCPRCLSAFRHRTAPDRTAPGWKWAICPNTACAYSVDRDVAAWQRIGARGLQHQHTTVLDRGSGTYVIRRTVQKLDLPVQHTPRPGPATPTDPAEPYGSADRTKAEPTRNRPVPRQRRRVPAPPATPATPTAHTAAAEPGGKRPAGRSPQQPTRHTQWRGRRQAPHTMSAPSRHQSHQRHQPTGARLGAGFHLHVHATPSPCVWPQPRSLFQRNRAESPAPPRKTSAHLRR